MCGKNERQFSSEKRSMDQKPEVVTENAQPAEPANAAPNASKNDIFAIISLIIGVCSFGGSCCVPFCGCSSLAGIVLGVLGLQSTKKAMAIAGIALNSFVI